MSSISIITPSFRSNAWLKLCIASVADQQTKQEHIIQDCLSDDGTLQWLREDKRVKAFIEKDSGMYDAINRGVRRSTGEVVAWLNCDEQYLPGTLNQVANYFATHPAVDVLFGDVIMTASDGSYICHRKMQVPLKYHTWTCHLSTLSCAMFFRRRVMCDYGFWLDPKWRDAGDGEWMVRLLKARIQMATLQKFTSVFTQTGANMSKAPNARREARILAQAAPFWIRASKPVTILHHRFRRLMGGMYHQPPFTYEIYTTSSPEERRVFSVPHPRSVPPASP